MTAIPRIDLSGDDTTQNRTRIAAEMAAAYRDVGFAYLTGHNVPRHRIDAIFDASRRFHALPQSAKNAITVNAHHRGYIPPEIATDRASSIEAAQAPNLSESFIKLSEPPDSDDGTSGRTWPLHGPNQWPDLPGFQAAVTAFENAAEALARRLLGHMAEGIGIDAGTVASAFDAPTAWLRLLHYPPQPERPTSGQFGSAPHTDFGCLTLLFQDNAGGLQVQAPDGAWIDVPPLDGAVIVNTGDIVPVWSAGTWRSTPHRVVNPPGRDRYSIAYFFDPGMDTVIEPLVPASSVNDRSFVFGDHVMQQLDATYDYRDSP